MVNHVRSIPLRLASLALVCLLGGCATQVANPRDPAEGFNRVMFSVNEGLDKAILRPVAQGYDVAAPMPVKTGVANFFGNLGDIVIAVNDLLQGKGQDAVSDVGRVAINSTIGVLGVIDWASDMGFEKHEEDFGQTLGRWGVEPGAYLVVPVFGPRDVRDTAGLAVDLWMDPVGNVRDVPARNTAIALRLISDRSALLPADKVIEEAALDKYAYIRDAYLQRRRKQVFDGMPPSQSIDD